jgi:hypothetical protein
MAGSESNGHDPDKWCRGCSSTISKDADGNETGHAADCEWG